MALAYTQRTEAGEILTLLDDDGEPSHFFSRLLSVSGQAEAEKAGTFPTPFYCFYLLPQLAPVEHRVGARQQREFDPERHIQQLRTSCSELLSSAPGLERQRRSWAFGPPSQEPSCRALTRNAL